MNVTDSLKELLSEAVTHVTNNIKGIDYVAPNCTVCDDAVIAFVFIYPDSECRKCVLLSLSNNGNLLINIDKYSSLINISDPLLFARITDYIQERVSSI